ncbi:N-acetyltransferase [Phenylobacterium sp. J367]|uniref:GNAT family N-acetyltransferase n=1 Tax=Phenylobacterium sp. J367 TaxID=2898435 RepID=UPI002150DAED|nr:GNAT family N-acetyltransferase [Phenylobacterium sp. J367]MCR5878986.1 GNAT family N-acetyltransferase [Phenylobacterium sp. J367]
MNIRILQPGDEALLTRAVAMIEEAELTPEAARAHLADPGLVAIAAEEAGAVAGFVYGYVLRRFEATSLFVYSVDVDERFRRRGVARAMIEAAKDLCRERGWDEMFVFTNRGNPAAMRLYASAGGIAPPPDDVVMFDFEP